MKSCVSKGALTAAAVVLSSATVSAEDARFLEDLRERLAAGEPLEAESHTELIDRLMELDLSFEDDVVELFEADCSFEENRDESR